MTEILPLFIIISIISSNKGMSQNITSHQWESRVLLVLTDNADTSTFLNQIKELQDVNKSAIQNADLPKRFLPCLTMGLAYYMSLKRPLVQPDRITLLKTNYEEMLARALLEDRETSSIYIVPRLTFYN